MPKNVPPDLENQFAGLMNDDQERWITIIPSMPEAEFNTALEQWREANASTLADMNLDHLRIDVRCPRER